MHGIFNRGLQSYVCDIFSPEIWEETCTLAELPFFNFETMLKYEDNLTDRVINALIQVMKRPREELLEDFGTYVISEDHFSSVRRLLRFGGENYEEFLHSLEDVHDRAKMAIPDLDVPRLRLMPQTESRFTLHYSFAKLGYGSVFLGMLRAMADDYGTLVVITHKSQNNGHLDIDEFDVSIMQPKQQDIGHIPLLENRSDGTLITLNDMILDTLLPLHVRVTQPGEICHIGPTLAQLLNGHGVLGQNLFELFEFRRPANMCDWQGLLQASGQGLVIQAKVMPDYNLKAVCIPVVDCNDIIMDISLGSGVYDIVSSFALNSYDFSPADPTAEMVFLKEVQHVVLENSIDLSTRLDGAKKIAETQAYTDALTGLPNRRAVLGFIQRLQERVSKNNFAVMQIDLDFFKAVNDTHGHAAGDHVLQEVAKLLTSQMRSSDMVARIGGDEFVVILGELGAEKQLRQIALRIIKKIAVPIFFGEHKCQIGASIGAIIVTANKRQAVENILEDADHALYLSKRQGRGTYNLANTPSLNNMRG